MNATDLFWESQSRRFADCRKPGARGRKASWSVRHALLRRHRRRPHPARAVRSAQRSVRHYDWLKAHGGEQCRDCMGSGRNCAACWLPSMWCECGPTEVIGCEPAKTTKCNVCFGYGWDPLARRAVSP